jgi:hypothetical protein
MCAALVGALVEAAETMSDRAGRGQERCALQPVVRPANVSMRDGGRRVGLAHEHRALPAPRPRRHALAVVDVDRDTEERVWLSVMLRRVKGSTVVKFTAWYSWLSRRLMMNLSAWDVEDDYIALQTSVRRGQMRGGQQVPPAQS